MTTPTGWRALCAELAEALEEWARGQGTGVDAPLLTRARAALAQPVPVGPTDEELKAAYWEAFVEAAPCGADESWLAGLQAVARLSRPAITPIPVSERLPGAEDCDAEGKCWCNGSCSGYEQDFGTDPDERLLWVLSRVTEENEYSDPGKLSCTHWLPHHALPVPTPANKET